MKKLKISLCLIVKNEIDGCKHDLPLIPKNEFDEIFAIDGGSTDGTINFLLDNDVKVYNQKNKGLNNAYLEANERAINENVVVFFPKKSLNPKISLEFKKYFENNNDLIIASRMLKNSQNEEDIKIVKYRKWSSLILSNLVSFIWRKDGNKIKDILHGVKGWKKSAFKKMQISNYGLTIDLEMVLQSYKLNLNRVEFPVKEVAVTGRKTNFPFWSTGIKLFSFLILEIFSLNKYLK